GTARIITGFSPAAGRSPSILRALKRALTPRSLAWPSACIAVGLTSAPTSTAAAISRARAARALLTPGPTISASAAYAKPNKLAARQLDHRGAHRTAEIVQPDRSALRQRHWKSEKSTMNSSRRLLMVMAAVMLSLLVCRPLNAQEQDS